MLMRPVILGELTADELRRLRDIAVLLRAIEAAPTLFTRAEVLDAYREDLNLSGEIRRRLELEPGVDVEWDLTFGVVHESDD